MLATLLAASGAAAQAPASADTARDTGGLYFMVGAAGGEYDRLNDALAGTRYPTLRDRPAYLVGVGVKAHTSNQKFQFAMEGRFASRRTQRDSDKAYIRSFTTGLSLLGGWRAIRHDRWDLSLLAGPEVQLVALTLRGPDTVAAQNVSFGSYVAAPPDKRTLFQTTYAATAGAEATFWSRSRPQPGSASTHRTGIGLRVQVTQPFARSRWRGTNDYQYLDDVRLGRTPTINSLRWSVAVVFTNLVNRTPGDAR